MINQIDPAEFRALYEGWVSAISDKNFDWFEKHLADDFAGTGHAWPKLRLDKAEFIELDKQIVELSADWQDVHAVQVGDLVVTVATLKMHREVFRKDTEIVGTDPEAAGDLASLSSGDLVNGKTCSYTGVWRRQGDVWQIIDHRMIDATA